MFGGVRVGLIRMLILAFGLALYQLWFKSMWDTFVLSQGWTVGVLETTIGYFLAVAVIVVFQKLITWKIRS